MKKYWAFALASWQQVLAYRAENVLWFLLDAVFLIPITSLWIYQYRSGNMSYQVTVEFVSYYFVMFLVNQLTLVELEESLSSDIKDGKVSMLLVKPVKIIYWFFVSEIVWRLVQMMYVLPTLGAFYFIGGRWVNVERLLGNIFWLLPFLFMIFIQRYLVSWLISLTAFWIDQSDALKHAKWMSQGVLGGQWLPMNIFPVWWQTFAKFTPFYYWFYFPVKTIIGDTSDFSAYLIPVAWTIILLISSFVFWSISVKKYSAYGN